MSDHAKAVMGLVDGMARLPAPKRMAMFWPMSLPTFVPRIVCLCGSTRFHRAFEQANLALTLSGCIVLSIGANAHDDELGLTTEQKARLDELHLRKIDLADCVAILNVTGYVGESTRAELNYAARTGKPVVFLEQEGPDDAA